MVKKWWVVVALFALCAGLPVHAQSVSFLGAPVNFGQVDVCASGAPAPCQSSLTLSYRVTSGGSFSKPAVLTQGATDQDFTLASSTCSGSLSAAFTCKVQVNFTPKSPGLRSGAVEILNGSGAVVATTYIWGVGLAPLAVFDGAPAVTLDSSANPNIFWGGLAVDGAGNLFYANGERLDEGVQPAVYELTAGYYGAPKIVGAEFASPQAVAVDGAGNLYVSDDILNLVVKVPPGCTSLACQTNLDGGFNFPNGLAIDGVGNVFVADLGNNRVVKMPAGCVTRSCSVPVGSGLKGPYAVAIDSAGNLFVSDLTDQRIVRIPAAGGNPVTVLSNMPFVYGLAVNAAGDLYMTDYQNQRILELPAGKSTPITLVSGAGPVYGLAADAHGNLFYSEFASSNAINELPRALPYTIFYNQTQIGTTSNDSPRTVPVENNGNQTLNVTGINVGFPANFSQVTSSGAVPACIPGLSLVPGASCDLSISFTATMLQPMVVAVELKDNSLNQPSDHIYDLYGQGGPPPVTLAYPFGFGSAPTPIVMNGGPGVHNGVLQLTDGGPYEDRSAFFSTRIGLSSFKVSFHFQLTGLTGSQPDADGFAFVLQTNGPNALGTTGGGLGYGIPALGQTGPSIGNSLAIKFDLHNNDGEGTSSTGLYLNGAAPTTPSINLLPSGIDLHSGHTFDAELNYDGATLTLSLTDQTTLAVFKQQFPIDIPNVLGSQSAYAGFTASTGAHTAVQNILAWQLSSSPCCTNGYPYFPTDFLSSQAGFDTGVTVNGETKISSGLLYLTHETPKEAGSIFFSPAVPIATFTNDFDFRMTRENADGFAFVVQAQGPNALGNGGGGLGYGPDHPGGPGAFIPKSVAVKFDLHSNAGEGSNSTGVYIDGASPTEPSTNLLPSGINLHSGDIFHVHMLYDGKYLNLTITDLIQYAVFSGAFPVDIPAAVGGNTAFVGFTAGTGDEANTIRILNWAMTSY